jgi:hypothetical protein
VGAPCAALLAGVLLFQALFGWLKASCCPLCRRALILTLPRESSPNMDSFYDGAQAACDWPSILPCPDLRPGPVDLSL